jgi:hypothetical protein
MTSSPSSPMVEIPTTRPGCVGGGHTLLPSCVARREQNVGSLSRRRLELGVADEGTIAHERLVSDALSVFGVLYRICVYGFGISQHNRQRLRDPLRRMSARQVLIPHGARRRSTRAAQPIPLSGLRVPRAERSPSQYRCGGHRVRRLSGTCNIPRRLDSAPQGARVIGPGRG